MKLEKISKPEDTILSGICITKQSALFLSFSYPMYLIFINENSK